MYYTEECVVRVCAIIGRRWVVEKTRYVSAAIKNNDDSKNERYMKRPMYLYIGGW